MLLPFRDVMDQLLFEMVLPNTLCSFERIGRDLVVHLWLEFTAGYDIVIIVKHVLDNNFKILFTSEKEQPSLHFNNLQKLHKCIIVCSQARTNIVNPVTL